MKLLLDTHVLLWIAIDSPRLSPAARRLLTRAGTELTFSAVSVWEVAIKDRRGRDDFQVDAAVLRRALVDQGYTELPVTGAHAVAVSGLPARHKDPFDRLLLAQAVVEGMTLVTADETLASYPGPVRKV